MASLVSNAGSRGTGSPSLSLVAQVFNLCLQFVSDSLPASSRIGGTRRRR